MSLKLKKQMKQNSNSLYSSDEYNYIITLVLIAILIVIRIAINKYNKQNLIIAWINFLSIFYVLWRIYYRVNFTLKARKSKSQILTNQFNTFNKHARLFIVLLIILMVIYSCLLLFLKIFYQYGSCINDILSLCALLFSIEDEKIVNKIIEHYRLKT